MSSPIAGLGSERQSRPVTGHDQKRLSLSRYSAMLKVHGSKSAVLGLLSSITCVLSIDGKVAGSATSAAGQVYPPACGLDPVGLYPRIEIVVEHCVVARQRTGCRGCHQGRRRALFRRHRRRQIEWYVEGVEAGAGL